MKKTEARKPYLCLTNPVCKFFSLGAACGGTRREEKVGTLSPRQRLRAPQVLLPPLDPTWKNLHIGLTK